MRGLPKLGGKQEGACEGCKSGKQTRSPHKPIKCISTICHPLELLHMDLVGPMQTESIGGKKSILDLVDDFPWVSFLHDKSEAFKSKCAIEYKLRRMHPVLASFDSELIIVRMHLLLSTVMKKESSMNSLLPLNKKGKKKGISRASKCKNSATLLGWGNLHVILLIECTLDQEQKQLPTGTLNTRRLYPQRKPSQSRSDPDS